MQRGAGGDQGRGQGDEQDAELLDGGRRQGLAAGPKEWVGVGEAVNVIVDLLLQRDG